MQTIAFKKGQSYQIRFVGDNDLRPSVEILDRTEKSVFAKVENKISRFVVKIHDNTEFIMPLGSYSMAPMCKASNPA